MNEKKNLYRITGRATVMDAVEATDTETAPETFHGQEPCVPRQEIRGHQGRGTCGWRMDFPTMIYEQEAAQIADERWHDMNIGDKVTYRSFGKVEHGIVKSWAQKKGL